MSFELTSRTCHSFVATNSFDAVRGGRFESVVKRRSIEATAHFHFIISFQKVLAVLSSAVALGGIAKGASGTYTFRRRSVEIGTSRICHIWR